MEKSKQKNKATMAPASTSVLSQLLPVEALGNCILLLENLFCSEKFNQHFYDNQFN